MANISSKHDKFVRNILSDKDTAIDYFRSALPAHVSGKLDFATLARQPGSYVNKELELTVSDVVFSCRRRDREGSVEISLLLEHKSYPDRYTPVQVGGYLFSGYQQQIKEKLKQLSPIIPIVFYHGKEKWEYRTLDRLFGGLDNDLLGYIPKYDYIYHNITDLPEEAILALRNQFLASCLLILKLVRDQPQLQARLSEILALGLGQASEDQQAALLIYSFESVDWTDEKIKDVLGGLPSDLKDKVMTTYDMLIEKGRKEERTKAQKLIEQERAEAEQKAYAEKLQSATKMKASGLSNDMIADIMSLPLDVVEKL